MESVLIHPIAETDIDRLITNAGGRRTRADADGRESKNADYVFGEAIVELKALDNEGLLEADRQAKLAALFREDEPGRPVIVIDRSKLPPEKQRSYDHIMQGPIKGAVASARKQLKQSHRGLDPL
jgi:hypothetical protein